MYFHSRTPQGTTLSGPQQFHCRVGLYPLPQTCLHGYSHLSTGPCRSLRDSCLRSGRLLYLPHPSRPVPVISAFSTVTMTELSAPVEPTPPPHSGPRSPMCLKAFGSIIHHLWLLFSIMENPLLQSDSLLTPLPLPLLCSPSKQNVSACHTPCFLSRF